MLGSGWGWLGVVVGRHTAGRNGRCTSNGGFLNGHARRLGAFSTAGARRLRPFFHYSSWLVWHKTEQLADGRLNRIRQVAPMCPPITAHWRHLANMIELVLSSAHPSPQPKQQIDRFRRFCTAYGRKSIYFTMGDLFHQNWTFSWGDLDPI